VTDGRKEITAVPGRAAQPVRVSHAWNVETLGPPVRGHVDGGKLTAEGWNSGGKGGASKHNAGQSKGDRKAGPWDRNLPEVSAYNWPGYRFRCPGR